MGKAVTYIILVSIYLAYIRKLTQYITIRIKCNFQGEVFSPRLHKRAKILDIDFD